MLIAFTPPARHKSILAYLSASGLVDTCASFKEELGLAEDFVDDATLKKYEGLLEKKWTSVVRLQKKVWRQRALLRMRPAHSFDSSDHGPGSKKFTASSRARLSNPHIHDEKKCGPSFLATTCPCTA